MIRRKEPEEVQQVSWPIHDRCRRHEKQVGGSGLSRQSVVPYGPWVPEPVGLVNNHEIGPRQRTPSAQRFV